MPRKRYEYRVNGELVSRPFPTEPVVLTDGEAKYWFSPPVGSGSKAYRYVAVRVIRDGGSIARELVHQHSKGWSVFPSKENWSAWAFDENIFAYDRFFGGKKVEPAALYHKWAAEAYRFLYHDEPQMLEKKLAAVSRDIEIKKQKAKMRREELKSHAQTYGEIEHGDLVITRKPARFKRFGAIQHFLMLSNEKGRLVPHIIVNDVVRKSNLVPAQLRKTTKTDYLKVCSAALQEVDNISGHERLRLLNFAQEVKDAVRRGDIGL